MKKRNISYIQEKNQFIKDLQHGMDEITINIFSFMMGHYGRRYIDIFVGFGGHLGFDTWQKVWGMSMEGLTMSQIENGKQKISSGEYCSECIPPSAGMFRLLCLSTQILSHGTIARKSK